MPRLLPFVFVSAGVVLGLVAAVGTGLVAASHDANTIHACARPNGSLRLVEDGADCSRAESAIEWNVQGPAGITPAEVTGLQDRVSALEALHVLSDNADLSGLGLFATPGGGGVAVLVPLSPAFDPATVTYSATVDGDSILTLSATPADENATLTVNGTPVTGGGFPVGDAALLEVVVTAEDGTTTKTYTVAIIR